MGKGMEVEEYLMSMMKVYTSDLLLCYAACLTT